VGFGVCSATDIASPSPPLPPSPRFSTDTRCWPSARGLLDTFPWIGPLKHIVISMLPPLPYPSLSPAPQAILPSPTLLARSPGLPPPLPPRATATAASCSPVAADSVQSRHAIGRVLRRAFVRLLSGALEASSANLFACCAAGIPEFALTTLCVVLYDAAEHDTGAAASSGGPAAPAPADMASFTEQVRPGMPWTDPTETVGRLVAVSEGAIRAAMAAAAAAKKDKPKKCLLANAPVPKDRTQPWTWRGWGEEGGKERREGTGRAATR